MTLYHSITMLTVLSLTDLDLTRGNR